MELFDTLLGKNSKII